MTPSELTLSKISRSLRPWILMPVRHTRSARAKREKSISSNERCKQGEACDRKVRALPQQADAVLHPPKGGVETGIDDSDIGHDRLWHELSVRISRLRFFMVLRLGE